MDVTSHIFEDDALSEIIERAVTFLETTNFHYLPLSSRFFGTGVYALYYNGENEVYSVLKEMKRGGQRVPIYVGKSVPAGWRQGRNQIGSDPGIFRRLKQHTGSIMVGDGLELESFECRFVILKNGMSNLISSLESELIYRFQPVWNSCIDGFGNHDPGKGRYEQAPF